MTEHRRQPQDRGRPPQGGGRPPRRDAPRRDEPRREPKYDPVHLPDDIVKELHTTARPGKGEILVKVFADAAAAFQANDFDEAIMLGDQAKHMALRAVSIREFLGLAYYHQGRWQEAARELSTFRRISGTAEQNPVLADSYRAMGKSEKALEYVDEIVRGTVPDSVYFEGAIVGAGAQADMDRLDDAIRRLEALDLQPKVAEAHHLRAWYMLGDLLARKGRFTQAREWFEAVASADPDMTDASDRVEKLR